MVGLRFSAAVLRRLLAIIGILLLGSLLASAQFDTGTIAGSVTDPSGAVIPNATVTVTNVGTSFQKTLQTDNGGDFVASALPFGTYVISASATNFAAAKSQPIVLNVGATVHANLALAVATAEQTVVIVAASFLTHIANDDAKDRFRRSPVERPAVNSRRSVFLLVAFSTSNTPSM